MTKYEETFERIVAHSIHREGIGKFIAYLRTETDFYTAPASTRFHEAYECGLMEHSLKVYYAFQRLNMEHADRRGEPPFTEEQVAILALFHDVCKVNFYEQYMRNVKNEDTGKWEQVPCYRVKDNFPYGHGEKSVAIIERFMHLSDMERLAIRWHMGGFDESVRGGSYALSNAYDLYPDIVLLHMADIEATYCKAYFDKVPFLNPPEPFRYADSDSLKDAELPDSVKNLCDSMSRKKA